MAVQWPTKVPLILFFFLGLFSFVFLFTYPADRVMQVRRPIRQYVLSSRAPTLPAAAAAARQRRGSVSIADRSLDRVGPVRGLRGGNSIWMNAMVKGQRKMIVISFIFYYIVNNHLYSMNAWVSDQLESRD